MAKAFKPLSNQQAAANYSVQTTIVNSIISNSNRTYGDILLSALIPNPFQPRKRYNQEKLQGLAISISENGLIEPIVVRRSSREEGKLEIVCGERRVRATRDILQWKTIHAEILESCTDAEVHRIAVLENVQREDLSPLEVAAGYQELLNEKDESGRAAYSIRSLGEKLGKNKDHIQEHVSLLSLPKDIQELLEQDNPIPRRVALELADIDNPNERSYLIQEYTDGQLRPKQLLTIIRGYKAEQKHTDPQEEEESFALSTDNKSGPVHAEQISQRENMSPSQKDLKDQDRQEVQTQPSHKNAIVRPNQKLTLITLRQKLMEQDAFMRKMTEKHTKNFPDMSTDERLLLLDYVKQWKGLLDPFTPLN